MNKKTKAAETKTSKSALVPKLRFPEFRNAPEWKQGELGKLLVSIGNGISLTQNGRASGYKVTRIETIADGSINLSRVGYISGCDDISAYKLNVGDILFSNINSVAHIGKTARVDRDYDLYHGMNLLRLTINTNQNDDRFVFFLLNTDILRESFRLRANKAVNQASINQTEVRKTKVVYPLQKEQKKIADCLSSVDELIAAEAQKVEALKAHKKGLMQLLFPAEGETLPKLRFPEFRDAPEWQLIILKDACNMQSGKFIAAAEIYEQQLADLYRCFGGNGLRGYTKTYNTSGRFPLVGRQGALCGNVKLVDGDYYATEHALVARPRNGVDVVWLYYLLDLLDLNRFATGQAQPGLSVEVLEKVPALKPKDELEQQRIADCLSSLDRLIAAEVQNVDALRAHKKGLMQQLFPVPEAEE